MKMSICIQLQVLQEFSVPNRAKTYGNAVKLGFFCPTWTSVEIFYLFPGEVSEDTDKIQEWAVSSVSFDTVS